MSKWWLDRVIYQIYPRSFCDSNGDGIGDISGIISKLDYLTELGVGAIWLSPVYVSPNRDHGYDVADYCGINPEYGTMADMKKLLQEAKKRDIKVIMDLVINHTSDEHPWFKSARDPKSEYRDYYIWRKPKFNQDGIESPPNNWTSFFTGPAWTKDEGSGEYYLHLFTSNQPDLNYRNPKVITEIIKVMKFWLDLGVAGFRCDVINLIYKQSLADGKKQLIATGREHYLSTAGCHRILQQFRQEVWEPYDAFIVGEAHMDHNLNSLKRYLHGNELSVAFVFEHMVLKFGYRAEKVKQALIKWQTGLEWNTVFFENHDGLRAVSRFGNDKKWHYESATMLATLLLTLRGTPFIFQGQEIGMTNAPFSSIDQIEDVVSLSVFRMMRQFGIPSWLAFRLVMLISRDHTRTPMHWDSSQNANFTNGDPWLMINPNYLKINVESAMSNEKSIWSYYHELLELRKENDVWRHGEINFFSDSRDVLSYERTDDTQQYLVVVNLAGGKRTTHQKLEGQVVASNYHRSSYGGIQNLRPYEALVIKTHY